MPFTPSEQLLHIGTDFAVFEDGIAEVRVFLTGPDLVEIRFAEGVAEAVVNIFVKTAGRYRAIPVDDGAVPQVATGIADFAFGRGGDRQCNRSG